MSACGGRDRKKRDRIMAAARGQKLRVTPFQAGDLQLSSE
jgi:hypothetical protein